MLIHRFLELFEGEALPQVFFAGGRMNLIGEHTDYNGGHVFPCALKMGTYCLIRKREDTLIRCASVNFPEQGVQECDLLELKPVGSWMDHCLGVVDALKQRGVKLPAGFELLVWGNLPRGAGLSSSASLEVAFGAALRGVFDLPLSNEILAHVGQEAENGFIGLHCGILDPFAIAMGREEQGILLDTRTLAYQYCPVELGEYTLLLMDTCKHRELASSAYNERRQQCEDALACLQKELEVQYLCEVTPEIFEQKQGLIEDEVLKKRARHAVYENKRTLDAYEALNRGDLVAFGQLLNGSHASLRDDYEVSCEELDMLVDTACSCPGVLGARMMGGGFGGCALALVHKEKLSAVVEKVQAVYVQAFGHEACFYPAQIGGEPGEILPEAIPAVD